MKECAFVYTNEFELLIQQSIKALEGSTYEVRCAVAKMLGVLVAGTSKVKLPGLFLMLCYVKLHCQVHCLHISGYTNYIYHWMSFCSSYYC